MIRTHFIALFTAFAALALAGCSEAQEAESADPPLYRIIGSDGTVEGWMLGTIHALPDGVRWRTGTVQRIIDDADYLVVEIAALDDRESLTRTFRELATTPGQPHIYDRVSPANRDALSGLIARSPFAPDDFSATETWAVSLMLAQVSSTGKTANGVDKAVIRDFRGREVREFEGGPEQLGIFDRLPEQDQRDLLDGVLIETELAEKDPGQLSRAWTSGDEAALEQATLTGIMADPELREALLVRRNRNWVAQLLPMLEEPQRPLVAVGAGHLVGADSIGAMLKKHGYTVERIRQ